LIVKAFSEEYFKQLKYLRKNKIMFFNGCFDIIHLGHISLFNSIKGYAQYKWPSSKYKIICGLNSDESVKFQEKCHPLINSQDDRAAFLEHLDIDVIIFDEKDPTALIMSLVPDIVCKGNDYLHVEYPEREFLRKADIEVKYISLLKGYSTTNIYNRIGQYVKQQIRESI
jgi:rfaE bifunctional protein nucleotidyltransferase chain/domain